jgi:hypothetical protein
MAPMKKVELAKLEDFLHEAEVEELDLPGADHGVGREQPV